MKPKTILENTNYIYKLNKNISGINGISLDQYNLNIILLILAIIFIFYLYIKIDLSIDEKNWDTNKCHPKYLFFSGYLKQDPGSSSEETTINNFYDCASSYASGLDDTLGLELEEKFGSIKSKILTFDNDYKEMKMKNSDDIDEFMEDISGQLTSIENDISFNISANSATTYNSLKNIGIYMDHFNRFIEYVSRYSKNYLSYLMMHYAKKYKIESEKDIPDVTKMTQYYSNAITIKNILNNYL